MSRNMEFSPVAYDVMRELATRLSGEYVAWMREASDEVARAHWREQHFRVMDEVDAVDSSDNAAIATHTEKLRREIAGLPECAPEVDAA